MYQQGEAMKKFSFVVAVIALLSLLFVAFTFISHEKASAQSSQSIPTNPRINQSNTTTFDTYKNKYPSFRLERTSSGILTVRMNTNGGPLVLSLSVRQDFPRLFHDIATDPGNEVVILTGSGGTWIKDVDFRSFGNVADPQVFRGTLTDLRRSLYNLLDIEVPVIAAVDGPALINSHFALVNDIVLASETAQFQDLPHIPSGLVPADGVQIVYEELLGYRRARYFLWTGQIIDAKEALQLGLVNEVVPSSQLLARANQLAQQLLKTPSITRRYTRLVLTKRLKNHLNENVPYDMGLEGASITASGNPNNP
jgi:enoyl-CoA hydratase/carnithine racemase